MFKKKRKKNKELKNHSEDFCVTDQTIIGDDVLFKYA